MINKILLLLTFSITTFNTCKKGVNGISTTMVSIFREHGLDVDWDHTTNRIAYSMKENDGFYDIHTANPDGTNDSCVSCNLQPLTKKHIAAMVWHPSGQWLMAVIEKQTHSGSSTASLPGLGSYCDIWIMNRTATKYFKLVDLPNDNNHGVIMPKFSHDGTKISWTDRKAAPNLFNPKKQAGYWTIKMADFHFNPRDSVPYINNIRTIEPVVNYFYEGYGFSPDDSKIIFCSNMNKPSFFDENIYTIDIATNHIEQLTTKDYNEHAFYNPNGSKIVWMSNAQASRGTDWWMMDADGNNKRRLTYFNEQENSQYAGMHVWCGMGSFSSDGKKFIGGRQVSLITQEGQIMMIEVEP